MIDASTADFSPPGVYPQMASPQSRIVADMIDPDRLWRRLMRMAEIGATADGGVNRPALSREDGAARRLFAAWARERGFAVWQDAIANLYVRREGTRPDLPPVVTGSHIDSQPTGGRFDGIYGVIAGFEALEALADAGIRTVRAVECVAWTNEEGSRFLPGAMGSAVFSGRMTLDTVLTCEDCAGVTVADALRDTLAQSADIPMRRLPFPIAAFVEAHIEQGPVLDAAGEPVGVVTGIQGQCHFAVSVHGTEAHAGTTPMDRRRDALQGALRAIAALDGEIAKASPRPVFTVGRMTVAPGSPNTVPGRCDFTIDLRHPDRDTLDRLADHIEPWTVDAAAPCTATVVRVSAKPPTVFDPAIVALVREQAVALGLPHREMLSGAGHDSMNLADIAPTGMVFVACEKGISHHPGEAATPADLADGARVLAATLVGLANR
jgi:N-carbamoyl-L-amino-acid hydrolase